MQISARNVLQGKVKTVHKGAVNSEIVVSLPSGDAIVAIITNTSVDSLGLKEGSSAFAVIKASEVMIGKGIEGARLSARNILPGTVTRLQEGAVNSEVEVTLGGGTPVVSSITKESVAALELKRGDAVSVIVKASHVLVGV